MNLTKLLNYFIKNSPLILFRTNPNKTSKTYTILFTKYITTIFFFFEMTLKSIKELLYNKVNSLTARVVVLQYYRFQHSRECYLKHILRNFDSNTHIHEYYKFIIETLDKTTTVFILVNI